MGFYINPPDGLPKELFLVEHGTPIKEFMPQIKRWGLKEVVNG